MRKLKAGIIIILIVLLGVTIIYQHNELNIIKDSIADSFKPTTVDINGESEVITTIINKDTVYIPIKYIEEASNKDYNWDLEELKLTLTDKVPERVKPYNVVILEEITKELEGVKTESDKLILNVKLKEKLKEIHKLIGRLQEKSEQLAGKEVPGKLEVIDKLIQLPDYSYNKDKVQEIIDKIDNVEYVYLELLKRNNSKIYLANGDLTDIPEFKYIKEQIVPGWGEGATWGDIPGFATEHVAIRIDDSGKNDAHGSINLELHELGHLIDTVLFQEISLKEEFKDIWKKEVKKMFNTSYLIDSADEYFAECFAYYYLSDKNNDELKKKAPLTHEFIKDLEDKAYTKTSYILH